MGPPVAHEEEEKSHVEGLDSEEHGQLEGTVPEQAVNGPQDQRPDDSGEGVGQQATDPGAPVIEQVLAELSGGPEGEEAADYRGPKSQEVEQVVEDVEHLVAGAEAEAQPHLREEQEEEVLQVPVEKQRCEVGYCPEGPQALGYFPPPEDAGAPAQEEEAEESKEEVEGDELPAGGQKGLAPVLDLPESGAGVVELGVDEAVDRVLAGPHLRVEHLGGLVLEEPPLLVLQLLHALEEGVHELPVVPFVVLVEPELVDVDEEAEKGQGLPPARNPVDECDAIVL